jgi:CHASE2 domain-containing sensor protein
MLPAKLLYNPAFANDPIVMRKCHHHIVVIGAAWTKNPKGLGGNIEGYDSPVGEMPGVYFHGNYIEDLIGRQYKPGLSVWLGIVIDLVIGLWLYYAYHRAQRKHQWRVLLIFFVPLVAVYILFYIFNRYLDFVLPLGLCFVHLSWEHLRTYARLRQAMP